MTHVAYYELVMEFSRESLEITVNSMIEKGWQPVGGPIVWAAEDPKTHVMCLSILQAMARYD
jgi:hypothetical protein